MNGIWLLSFTQKSKAVPLAERMVLSLQQQAVICPNPASERIAANLEITFSTLTSSNYISDISRVGRVV